MRNVARYSDEDRADVIRIVAAEAGLPDAVVEKDFWVCYTLDHLFHRCDFGDSLVFKGGTSLSKAYGLINRFSEDIDLILDWRCLGYEIAEPWAERSNSKQAEFTKDSEARTNSFLADTFVPMLVESISSDLDRTVAIRMADEPETVIFEYPRTYHSSATLDIIRLEIGPLAAWSPTEHVDIKSSLAEHRPGLFTTPETSVTTVKPERTFWEKATILHQEANREAHKRMPLRYSRHYYDMYQLGRSHVRQVALDDVELLARVVAFKEKFYRAAWAKLDEAVPGTFKLVPPEHRMAELQGDYEAMREMIIGEPPALDEIMSHLREIEMTINGEL